ncbi:carbohydrate kinase family protein [Candidatus Saccharibacteria bacterium]|nr:carbohydrate kinase family protein [Candidatus Saccharibacteria bacterium]
MVKICALGSASQDVFLSGKGIEAKFEPSNNAYFEEFKLGTKLNVEKIDFAIGGGASNAAVTFARQGHESSFVGKLGGDIPAQNVINELDHENVDTRHVIFDENGGTQYSTILLADTGERTILIYRGVGDKYHVKDYEDMDFSGFEWLYVSTLSGSVDVLDYVFSKAKSQNVKIAFNPGDKELRQPEKLKPLIEDVDILIVNKDEAQLIVNGESLEELTRRMMSYVPLVIISDGPNGVIASDGKTIVRAGMYEDVKVVDRTGAGDAFGSGFVSKWSEGKSLKDAIVFASANSTSVVTKIGAKAGILHKGAVLHAMPLDEKPF